ncbi:hypothetical protein ABNR98_004422 [Salmonella enterica]
MINDLEITNTIDLLFHCLLPVSLGLILITLGFLFKGEINISFFLLFFFGVMSLIGIAMILSLDKSDDGASEHNKDISIFNKEPSSKKKPTVTLYND